MSITFTNVRYFRTDVGHKIFQNVPTASQWFKLKVTAKSSVPSQTAFLAKAVFDFWHSFNGLGNTTSIPLRFTCTNSVGSFAQADLSLTIGVVYGIAVTWDGLTGHQRVWLSGIPTQMGTFTGNTQNNSSAMQIGIGSPAGIVYTIDDLDIWNNYLLTSTDIADLLGGADPTTIGTGATWRGRWTLAGPDGAPAAIGHTGLQNAFGDGGSLASGGDGSDCIVAGGTGTALYAPSLVWTPTVTQDPAYVDTSGEAAVFFFESLINGTRTTISQILTTPTVKVNDVDLGSLGTPWFTGYHPMAWFPMPAGVKVTPSDVVKFNAPVAWANTPAGSVEAMDDLLAANRVGKSVVRPDDYVPTLPIGVNNPQNPMTIWGFYYPFKNWKYRTYGGVNKRGAGVYPIYSNSGVNGIDATHYPGSPGLKLVMWNTDTPSNVNQFAITTTAPSTTSITERTDLKASPGSGIGMCRVFDVQHVLLTGSADLVINLTISGTVDYTDEWIVLGEGDFDIVDGAVVLDRSDPWALSQVYQNRVPSNVGSLRWEDSTIGGNPGSFPFPEKVRKLTDESWGDLSTTQTKIGYTSIGPVDPVATPYIYSPFLGRPGTNGHSFTATLANPILTAPAQDTKETWVFTDGATAPLISGLEIRVDSEDLRLVSPGIDANHWLVNRGSNNTVPATHAAGPVTVFGRTPITTQLTADGHRSGGVVWQFNTAVPHGLMSGSNFFFNGNAYPPLHFDNGFTVNLALNEGSRAKVNGPQSIFMFVGTVDHTSGVLTAPVTLDPTTHYWDQRWPIAASMPHEACAIVTGKFPDANLHVNLWPDASDDLVCHVARGVLANFPAGRKVYVEYNNEPWNFSFGGFTYHNQFMGPMLFGAQSYPLVHYAYRAFQVHSYFRDIFVAAGRGDEIVGILNCQMGNNDAQNHLNYAISVNKPVDAVAIAPYVQTEDTSYNNGLINTLSDEQVISIFVHDLWYNPRTYNQYAATDKGYIHAYNTATGHNCILMGYEGGIEFVIPNNTSIAHRETRNHDCITNPDWYIAEGDFYAWLQMQGFDHLHVYALAMFWGPQAWGMYHGIAQEAGRGDGSDGKFNNLLCRANPASPQYKGATVNQDLNTVSVRGQAFIDWLGSLADAPPPTDATAYTVTPPSPPDGSANVASGNFLVQVNGVFTGTITATLSGGGLSTSIVLTWADSSDPQIFSFTPTATGTVTLTFTNDGGLTNPDSEIYTVAVITTTIIIYGMAGGFYITQGYGDSSAEPPAFVITQNTLLGDDEGGLVADDENPSLDSSD